MGSHTEELILVDHEDELIVDKDTYNGLLDTAGKVDALLTELSLARRVVEAHEDIMRVIDEDELIPESISYMKNARAALAAYREEVG